jgi:hypothetical protein
MTKYSQLDTAELIAHFVHGATRLGTVFNLPLKMDRKSPQGKWRKKQGGAPHA